MSFGFWRYMTSRSHREILWVPHLHHAFPPGTKLKDVDSRVGDLHELRNRAAHHEPLLTKKVADAMAGLDSLAGWLLPELPAFIRAHSTVDQILNARP